MKLLKSFFSFLLPLTVMLIAFCLFLIVNKVVDNYKANITNDYSIVVISNTPLITIDELAGIDVKEVKILQRENIIKGVKENLSESSLKLLNSKLPYFYNIYLEEFPTTQKLEQIRKELTTIASVKRVETFSKDHNKIYSILMLIQNIVITLFSVILILSFLLIGKQIKIWFFEHIERIKIIQLHGGSVFYSSKPIFRIMLGSTVLSVLIVSTLMYMLITNISMVVPAEIIELIPGNFQIELELLKIALLAFVVPLVTFFGLIIKYKLS